MKDKKPISKIEIDINSTEGNAFSILEVAKRLSKEMGYDYNAIFTEMTTGDYDNLVNVFDSHFGEFVIIYK
jgi:hypothetical protein